MQLKNCTKRSIAHILRDKPKKCCNFMQRRGKNHHFSRFIPIYSLATLLCSIPGRPLPVQLRYRGANKNSLNADSSALGWDREVDH